MNYCRLKQLRHYNQCYIHVFKAQVKKVGVNDWHVKWQNEINRVEATCEIFN